MPQILCTLVLALVTVLAGPCPAARAAEPLLVVATFSILGDMTRTIGGERVRVHELVGPDGDAHVYEPTPADARLLVRARLVVTNGLGFEGWIDRLVKSAGYRGPIVVASRGAATLASPAHGKGHAHQHGHVDPHAWQDVANARRYAANIEAALSALDPAGAAAYRANAAAYAARLDALDAEIRAALGQLPPQRRRVVSSHDAFAYFGHAYGLEFVAPVGVSTAGDASAADVGRLIRQLRAQKIPAVFMENIANPRLIERVRSEAGARIGGTLYSDALSAPGGPAATYLDMMRHNLRTLTAALVP
jgi:zinc/manganese transport system substrate-binding protein